MGIGMTELQKQFGGVLQLYSKIESEFFNFFQDAYFYRTPPVAASGINKTH